MFSPDGKSIAFWSGGPGGGTLKRLALSGGAAVALFESKSTWMGGTWGREGILFPEFNVGIMRVNANGGEPAILVKLAGDEIAQRPSMLPGGEAVLFTLARYRGTTLTTGSDMWAQAAVVAQSLISGQRKVLVKGGSDARYVPSGHLIYSMGGVLLAVPFDVQRLEVIGDPVPVVEGVSKTGITAIDTGSAHVDVSANGSLVYIPGPVSTVLQTMLVSIDRAGHTESLKLPPGVYIRPRVSPKGTQIAYGTDDGRSANVWVYDLSGASAPRQLTFEGRNRSPIWSADGQYIAFQSDREGTESIYRQRSDGSTKAERLTEAEMGASHNPESWSPDGTRFLFTVVKGLENTVWTFSLNDRKAAPFGDVKTTRLISPVFSPDGSWVAYSEASGTGNQSFVQPFPSTGAKYSIGRGNRVQWSPDGNEVFFLTDAGTMVANVTTESGFKIGNPSPLPVDIYRGLGAGFGRNADVMPDGKRFIAAVPTAEAATAVASTGAREIRVVLNWLEELKRLVPTN
jgi:Tol biopolymer transport system component